MQNSYSFVTYVVTAAIFLSPLDRSLSRERYLGNARSHVRTNGKRVWTFFNTCRDRETRRASIGTRSRGARVELRSPSSSYLVFSPVARYSAFSPGVPSSRGRWYIFRLFSPGRAHATLLLRTVVHCALSPGMPADCRRFRSDESEQMAAAKDALSR